MTTTPKTRRRTTPGGSASRPTDGRSCSGSAKTATTDRHRHPSAHRRNRRKLPPPRGHPRCRDRTVTFYWDGAILGAPVPFERLLTGASRGLGMWELTRVRRSVGGHGRSGRASALRPRARCRRYRGPRRRYCLPRRHRAEPDPDLDPTRTPTQTDTGTDDGDDTDDDDGSSGGDGTTSEPDESDEADEAVGGTNLEGKASGCSQLGPAAPAGLALLMLGLFRRREAPPA